MLPKDPKKIPEYLQKLKDSSRKRWEKQEEREKSRKSAIKRWENSEERENLSKKKKGVPSKRKGKNLNEIFGEEAAENIFRTLKENGKKIWEDPVLREKQLIALNTKEVKQKQIQNNKRTWKDPIIRNKRIDGIKKAWANPKIRKKQLIAIFKSFNIVPNSKELQLWKILEELFPDQFKFVGDGSLIIDFKSPDFIHISKSLIIELFGDYWHSKEKTGQTNEEHEQERIYYFKKFGYKILIVWEQELENENLLKLKLRNFVRG